MSISTPTSANKDLPVFQGDVLQQLIDQTHGSTQKIVTIPSGVYLLRDAIRLRSGLHLKGEGCVVIQTQPIVSSPLLDIVGYGHSEFRVAEPQHFDVGQGFCVTAENKGGFGVTVGCIVAKQQDTFFTDTPFYADYWPAQNAAAITAYPAVAGDHIRDVILENVVIQGSHTDVNPWVLNGCRSAGIYLIGCVNVHLKHVEIHHYHGDAVSFQQCADVYVQDCHIHDNAGHGVHPGSGTVRYVMAGNHIHNNGDCGIYYCLRTTHSICRDNRIEANVNHGITIGERDTHHLIIRNSIGGNGKAELIFRKPVLESGNHVIVRDNHFKVCHDMTSRAGKGETSQLAIEVSAGLHDVHLIGNIFEASGTEPVIRVANGCTGMTVGGNRYHDRPWDAGAMVSDSPVLQSEPPLLPGVDPAVLGSGGARHLRIKTLGQWVDRTID